MKKICSVCGIEKDLEEFRHCVYFVPVTEEIRKQANTKRINCYKYGYSKKCSDCIKKKVRIGFEKIKYKKLEIERKEREYYIRNKERIEQEYLKKRIETQKQLIAKDSYIANQLGIVPEEIQKYPELIEAKRVQLQIKRELQNH